MRVTVTVGVRRLLSLTALVAATTVSAGCSSDDVDLTVLTTPAFGPALTDLADRFEATHDGITITVVVDEPAALLEQTGTADVLVTSDPRMLDQLGETAVGDPTVVATDVLTLVVPADNPGGLVTFEDLDAGARYAVCEETVPCGSYVDVLLEQSGVDVPPTSREPDAAAVLDLVMSGRADGGLVFAADAAGLGDDVSRIPIPGAERERLAYPAVVLDARNREAAADFVDYLTSDDARAAFDALGLDSPT